MISQWRISIQITIWISSSAVYSRGSFSTKIGRGIHERKGHQVEANERIPASVESHSVGLEEMKLHVAEADTELRSEKHTNEYLMGVFGKSTTVELNRLKNIRSNPYSSLH